MNGYQKGNLAKSIAGHDKEQIFVIVREKGEYVYVADGRQRTIEKPKRKNKKHIQPIYCNNGQMLEFGCNEEIRRVIKLFSAKERRSEGEICQKQML